MPPRAQDLRRFLFGVLVDLLEIDPASLEVIWLERHGHWVFEIGAPDEVRGLLLGSGGRHADALEVLVKMRALRAGVTERLFVHVRRDR